jgi:phosphocarrier protein
VVEHTIAVKNTHGLHARPAARFVELALQFDANLSVRKSGRIVNAKSLVGILSLGVDEGSTVTIVADGPDECDAVKALARLLELAVPE